MSSPPSKPKARPPAEEEIPAPSIPDQELLRCIGQGSYGEVWLSRGVTGSYRGVKVVRRERFDHDRPFDREFRGLQNFERISLTHPGLVALLHVGRNKEAGYFYYVMELADDVASGRNVDPSSYVPRTLRSEISRRGRLPAGECVEIAINLAASLAHLERHGLIHRDVKPSNVIFVSGVPKLADIGLVTQIGEPMTGACTPRYTPPEGPGGPTTDTYGLGRVLYETITGYTQEHFPEWPTDLLEGAETKALLELNKIILRACAFAPEERYPRAEAMHADLLRLHRRIRSRGPMAAGDLNESPTQAVAAQPGRRVYVSHAPNAQPELLQFLEDRLPQHGFEVFVEEGIALGLGWVDRIEEQIRNADAVIVLLSADSIHSEMVAYHLELASEAARQKGAPRIVPVRVGLTEPLPQPLAKWIDPWPSVVWQNAGEREGFLADLVHLLGSALAPETAMVPRALEAVGGAVPLDSRYYIERSTDQDFKRAIQRRDSIVLVKGARQIGKTSLLARGLQHARDSGAKVVLTDFQKLDAAHLASADSLYLRLGDFLADQLDLAVLPEDAWDKRRSPNTNFERYLRREVLGKIPGHFVWGLDEVDRLFACPFGSEVFGLLRSWHNERALDPNGPWSRLTLAIAYATEAHLFITDVNQSPFNVGTRLSLEDFSLEHVADLNQRHGSPLGDRSQLTELFRLLGGQPYLVRHALNELAGGRTNFAKFKSHAASDEGIFGDHLRRILVLLAKDPRLCEIVQGILGGQPCRDATGFYRLRTAGILKGDALEQAQMRCAIYEYYLKRHLH